MNSNDGSIFSMIRLGLILAVYAVASCTVLALVNNITSPVIKQNQERKAQEGMKTVFPLAESFVPADNFSEAKNAAIKIDGLFIAKSGSDVLGAIAQVTGPTYDQATILVGLDTKGIVTGLTFLKNTDSPGFGLKASDSSFKVKSGKTFYGQFAGLDSKEGFVSGKNFDAISGATITSNGIAELVSAGVQVIQVYLKENHYE